LSGCDAAPRASASHAYYRHDYPAARDALRRPAADRAHVDVVLDNLRLGMACLADGDYDEAERSLLRAYEYLVSGSVNAPDREVGSVLLHEGVTVWKGEPYEQAMAFYYVAALYMLRGDWENARAAAANSLFALRDFGDPDASPRDMGQLARDAAEADKAGRADYLSTGYKLVESQFALGYLLAATADALMNRPHPAARLFDHVRRLRPDLDPLASTLQHLRYDTLLLVDVGFGPRKQAYGPDDALIRFTPDGRSAAPLKLHVSIGGKLTEHAGASPAVDLWTLSQNPKWWSLENVRQAKSTIGSVLLFGGMGAAVIGSQARSKEAALAGIGAAALGALMKAGSRADTRHLETLPRCAFLVPLNLGPGSHDVSLRFEGDGGADGTWHDLAAGAQGRPRVYYLRMHNAYGLGMPAWAAARLRSVAPEQIQPGDKPWILGGADLSPPSQAVIDAYHARGSMRDMNLTQLRDLYRGEGLLDKPGPQGQPEAFDPATYRHLIDGGRVLFCPPVGSFLYQRATRQIVPPYQPRGEPLRRLVRTEPQTARSQP
jgi:tetratricopeptide (TPR) repeat protein